MPRHFPHHYKMIREYANVYDDADDTSAGVLAYYYAQKYKLKFTNPTDENYYVNFVKYRDIGKRKANWYNKRLGHNIQDSSAGSSLTSTHRIFYMEEMRSIVL